MGDEKTNSDYMKRQKNKSTTQGTNKEYEKKIEEDILGQGTTTDEKVSMEQPIPDTSETDNGCDIKSLTDKVVNINLLRFELDKLTLDFKARAYFENDIKPLIDTLNVLSYGSANFSISATNMAGTNFGHSSKIKESLDLVEEINEIAEELIEVLKCKVHNMLKFSKYDI
ncbi:hypothetical protein LGK97_04425 [Clostridium sp. CS001]|uniref:hypothetical protein n=1 Tax=Clostridium sp. CS001 TaxID=2880648 RepID=UPI001CF58AF5|nr:hypothetical protein [Clostridium sp. CS001]MCB2289012.1 hypothetical protein [Clostridium sp. CS001]